MRKAPELERIWTVMDLLRWGTDYFTAKDIDSPRLTMELMVGSVLQCTRLQLYTNFEQPLTKDELAALRHMIERRVKREPLQYILGHADFYGLSFNVTPAVLIPRPETEILVERAVRFLKTFDAPVHALDIGTGTGCIPIACLKYHPGTQWTAIDKSQAALDVARRNAERHGALDHINFVHKDFLFDSSLVTPHSSLDSSLVTPHLSLDSSLVTPHSSLDSSLVTPHLSLDSSLNSSLVTPHLSLNSSLVTPHLSLDSSLVTSHLSLDSSLVTPHSSLDSSLVTPHLSLDSSLVTPHLSLDSSLVTSHLSLDSSLVTPHLSLDSSLVTPHLSLDSSLVTRRYSLICMNPPYIPSSEIPTLQAEVKDFEPLMALTDDGDGTAFYVRLAEIGHELLEPTGRCFMEVAQGQSEVVQEIFSARGYKTSVILDLASIPRIVTANLFS